MIDVDTVLGEDTHAGPSPPTQTRNMFTVILNGNPNGGSFLQYYDSSSTTPTDIPFNPNPSSMLKSRYNTYRPMAAKVTIKVTGDSGDGNNVAPFKLVAFPFTSGSASLSNNWDGLIASGFTPSTVEQFKYVKSATAEGRGGKSSATISYYINFAKLGGYTPQQYMADASVTCETIGTNDPQFYFKLGFCVADWTPAGNPNNFNVQVKIRQYGRWEAIKLQYQ